MEGTTTGYAMDDLNEQSTFRMLPSSAVWFPNGDDKGVPRLDTIVSNGVVRIVEIAVVIVLCGIICVFGLVANALNILVFFRQGALSSSSNVSLLALAFADTGCLIPVLCNSVSYALHSFGQASVFLTPRDFFDTVVIWPHIMCMQIASWITAYIAFERCMCVLLPLKIKSLFSAKKSLIVTTLIAMVVIVSFIPTFVTQRIAKISDDPFGTGRTNTTETRIIFWPTELHMEIVGASDIVHAIILRPIALAFVFLCTQITIYRVKLSSSWRKSMMTYDTSTSQSAASASASASASATSAATSGTTSAATSGTTTASTSTAYDTKTTDRHPSYPSSSNNETETTTTNPRGGVEVAEVVDVEVEGNNCVNININSISTTTTVDATTGETNTNANRMNNMNSGNNKTTNTNRPNEKTKRRRMTSAVSKETRLIKMITVISSIFMVCNAPDILGVFVLVSIQERLQLTLSDNLFFLIIAAQLCLESLNSSINIVVYYRMSSMYRHTFRAMVGKK